MTDTNDKKVAFIPFHALNQFMRADYRSAVIRTTVLGMRDLPGGLRSALERQIKRHVSVPGFRNSAKAPLSLVARHLPDAFEKSPDLVKVVLAAWAEHHSGLRAQVFDLLTERGWEMLPQEADRTRLPGFLTVWPADEDFEKINRVFFEKYPQAGFESDDVSLMAVWLSGRLPVEVQGEAEESDLEPKV
jgi:hypothetical protein